MRKLEPGRLVIASHNEGKVREIVDLLGPYGIEPVSAAELDLPEPDEIGATFIDNADLKARAAADLSGLPALADDSGLCVDALGDRPGIFSARWALVDPRVPAEADPGEVTGERGQAGEVGGGARLQVGIVDEGRADLVGLGKIELGGRDRIDAVGA